MRKICKNDLTRSNVYFLLILLGSIFVPFILAFVFYFLGIRNELKGIIHPAHNSLFDIDEDALPIGVAIQCEVAINYLTT